MKSIIAIALTALVFGFVLTACSQTSTDNLSTPSPSDGHRHSH